VGRPSSPTLTGEVLRELVRAVFGSLRRGACARRGKNLGPKSRCGAVTFVQRFGDALNLKLRFRTLALDGVYEGDRFRPLAPLDDREVPRVAARGRRYFGSTTASMRRTSPTPKRSRREARQSPASAYMRTSASRPGPRRISHRTPGRVPIHGDRPHLAMRSETVLGATLIVGDDDRTQLLPWRWRE
jgi:hypothetical protein